MRHSNARANQWIFTQAWNHIINQQKGPCIRDNSCVYNDNAGHGCAFAPAIQVYDPILERNTAAFLLLRFGHHLWPEARLADDCFASQLQACHDSNTTLGDNSDQSEFLAVFEKDMRVLAEDYDLEIPE